MRHWESISQGEIALWLPDFNVEAFSTGRYSFFTFFALLFPDLSYVMETQLWRVLNPSHSHGF